MAQQLDAILQELDAGYAPSRQLIQQRLDALPGQADAEVQGLNAQKDSAFNDITNGARDRGIGFSGIPLGEQAKYVATDFLPAVARVKQSQNDVKTGLLGALNDTNLDQRKTALGIQSGQQQMDFQREQANRQLALAQQSANAMKAALGSQAQPTMSLPGVGLKDPKAGAKGGYSFNFGNKPVSAIGYAQVNNVNPADILYTMASNGDSTAAAAYRDIVNNKGTITPALANKYYSLFWGTNLLQSPQPVTIGSGKGRGGGGGGF